MPNPPVQIVADPLLPWAYVDLGGEAARDARLLQNMLSELPDAIQHDLLTSTH